MKIHILKSIKSHRRSKLSPTLSHQKPKKEKRKKKKPHNSKSKIIIKKKKKKNTCTHKYRESTTELPNVERIVGTLDGEIDDTIGRRLQHSSMPGHVPSPELTQFNSLAHRKGSLQLQRRRKTAQH